MDLSDDNEKPENVEIHLQSRTQDRYLHGDLQKARPPSGEYDINKVIDQAQTSSASESETESVSSSATDEVDMTPRASPTSKASFIHGKRVKQRSNAPLGAVELKPFNHQVGGHTTVFRFSKRAVCKQLTSRENRFYETVENYHPELMKFLPKYGMSAVFDIEYSVDFVQVHWRPECYVSEVEEGQGCGQKSQKYDCRV